MNRPSSIDDRLAAWLDEGPDTGPDDLLTSAHARARSMRQLPGWWLELRGVTMDTTLRARPALPVGLAFILLAALVAIALVATAFVVGSRPAGLLPEEGRNAAPPPVPVGPEALLAFTSWTSAANQGDLYVVRADGTDGRHLTSDALDDTSPAWSPDGTRIAFDSGTGNSPDRPAGSAWADGIQLRVASSEGIKVLADNPGCFQSTQSPAWSPDGRFLLYSVDRLPEDGDCNDATTDVFVVPADGSAPGRRLLATPQDVYTTLPAWAGDRIALRGNAKVADHQAGGLWVAQVTDPDRPWDLAATRVEDTDADPVSFGWSRWSPDGTALSTTYIARGTGYGNAIVYAMDGSPARSLWSDPTVDSIVPDWSPDGSALSLLVLTRLATDHGVYQLAMVESDGTHPKVIATPELSGNGGPAMFSPDGSRVAVRAIRDDAIPGDLLIVDIAGTTPAVRLAASQWSSVSWQPAVQPDNPAAAAPVGLPAF